MTDAFDEAVTHATVWMGEPSYRNADPSHSVARWESTDGDAGLEIARTSMGYIDVAAHHGSLSGPMETWVMVDPHAVEVALCFVRMLGLNPPAKKLTTPAVAVHEAMAWLRAAGVTMPSVAD